MQHAAAATRLRVQVIYALDGVLDAARLHSVADVHALGGRLRTAAARGLCPGLLLERLGGVQVALRRWWA